MPKWQHEQYIVLQNNPKKVRALEALLPTFVIITAMSNFVQNMVILVVPRECINI
jgi:hypothetical protein